MKSPAEYIVGFLFTFTSMLFWYGGYTVFYVQYILIKYWWAFLAVGVSFTAGRLL